ncbi:hypothetical protein GCM10009665_65790 [Kitasatospora nipponensis]|uniref:DoxX-like protein n=1 Tax=Kitasatospora nipponensis TaxID=258049 RepID=A0ABN1WYQ2_9ACTN
MKPYARAALWTALAVQAIWFVTQGSDAFGVCVLVALGAFAALSGRHPGTGVAVRVLMAADFLLSVGARFGAFGGPDTPGVTWGDFAHFTSYTRQVASFLPAALAPVLAVLATIAELGFALALLSGFQLRHAARGAACLLASFGISMTISLPVADQFHYCVFALAAAMLALSTVDRHPLSLDNALTRARARREANPVGRTLPCGKIT